MGTVLLAFGNEGEAQLVCAQVDALVKLGVQQDQIAVITPYNLQVSLCIYVAIV